MSANTRGIALVIVAAALGIFLIAKSFDTGSTKASTAPLSTTTTTTGVLSSTTVATGVTTPVGASTGPSTPQPSTSLGVSAKVLVLNASGKSGAAGRLATTLSGAGYTTAKGNANQQRATTVIYYVNGHKAEALAVAAVMNLASDVVGLLPAGVVDAKTLGSNVVVVLLGTDKAT